MVKNDKKGINHGINKNTYYMLPIWFISLCNTKKYKINTQKEIKNKSYITIEYYNITLKVGFKALFNSNSKIKGIKSLDFDNANHCSSYRLGLCQVGDKNLCYAHNFEHQYLKSHNGYYWTFNAYLKGFLMSYVTRELSKNNNLKSLFMDFIDNHIDILRFNVNSDFKNINDFKLLLDIVSHCQNTVIYGYTARDDLLIEYNDNKDSYKNLTINGSNESYDNRYKCTFSLKEYYMARYQCLGACLECKKCFKLNNITIINLFHHSQADTILNTYKNREFIIKIFKAFNIDLNHDILKINKGLFSNLNKYLKDNYQIDLKNYDIKSLKTLMDGLQALHYEIMDNIDLYDKKLLMELRLI